MLPNYTSFLFTWELFQELPEKIDSLNDFIERRNFVKIFISYFKLLIVSYPCTAMAMSTWETRLVWSSLP